jgi:hypothetical protein
VTDVFEEVEEQLRSDQYITLARRYLPWGIGILVAGILIAAAVWGYGDYQTRQAGKAAETYAEALELVTKGDKVAAYTQFETVVKVGSKGYKALALMQQGGLRLDDHKTDEAIKLFDAAAEAAPTQIIGDAARLKSAFALMDTASFTDLEKRLKPLTDIKRPYRAVALEALAIAKLSAGKVDEAKSDFNVITLLPDAPSAMRERANAAISLIDSGTSKSLKDIAKAAMALPEPSSLAPAMANPGQSDANPQAGAAQ